MAPRRLIVNADDFGFTADVNTGIVEAHQRGILTATTLMANGAAFDQAVDLARRRPSLDVGCHIVLVGGKSVLAPHAELPRTAKRLVLALAARSFRKRIQEEIEAQVEKILRAGLEPTHLDTHKHTHLMPPVLESLCRISEHFSIPWVRRPFDLPMTAAVPLAARVLNVGLGALRGHFQRTLTRYRCRATDHFAGFQLTGRFRATELAALIRSLPQGLTEFMCHPGHCTEELRRATTRLKESRAEELEALTSPEIRQALQQAGIELTNFRSATDVTSPGLKG